jgi:RNA polymerase sigma factor (sigma-70 family)
MGDTSGMSHSVLPILRARARRAMARASACVDVDDLVHEIWIELFADDARRLSAYDPGRGRSLAAWVRLVADRELATLLRRARAQKRGNAAATIPVTDDLPAPTPDVEAWMIATDLATRLTAHLERSLSAPGRRVFECTLAGDRSCSEIAVQLGVSVQVVYNWQHRIRRLAREFVVESNAEK